MANCLGGRDMAKKILSDAQKSVFGSIISNEDRRIWQAKETSKELAMREEKRQRIDLINDARELGNELCDVWDL